MSEDKGFSASSRGLTLYTGGSCCRLERAALSGFIAGGMGKAFFALWTYMQQYFRLRFVPYSTVRKDVWNWEREVDVSLSLRIVRLP